MNQLYVTVEEVKKHLNIEEFFTEDDKYILSLIEVAHEAVKLHLNGASIVDENNEIYPNIKQAILLLIGTLYNNRESITFASSRVVSHAYDYLLQLSKSYEF